ncbi:lysophospholipid acyltransferase family protein [Nonomuraea soli]|uniref:1-acyl-sn-glycerol-3-phosphate acyltransferase n=1 Tax=Nonomuraea soli TaxID=1032476 RepID=A0A7W0CFA9_9ACTN|nr:lysophospholipid acyltransferase family protein [Nonomuraea soli]MBA2889910.1 1-acyl-sn-glycerol-3-phosphate acyltransferase [Nonomuraea soli]
MAELVYTPVIAAAKTVFRVMDYRFRIEGTHNVPRSGGAVLVSNHISYLDFIFAGYGALLSAGRLTRFMAKKQVFDHPVSGPLMRGMRHIPVDRAAGADSYARAVGMLRAGEVVGVFAEATISRSFTVKEIKNGSVRMAQEAGVPLIPMALWGTQRLWTKGRPKQLGQRHVPITIVVGEPMRVSPGDDVNAVTLDLRERMTALAERAQSDYPDRTAGAWWLPAHLGGSAPTPEEAAAMDAEEAASRRKGD